MLKEIEQAIYELEANFVSRSEMVIAMSDLVYRHFEREVMLTYFNTFDKGSGNMRTETFAGVKIYREWPYNEVLVYTPKGCYHPQLVKKIISFNVPTNTTIS